MLSAFLLVTTTSGVLLTGADAAGAAATVSVGPINDVSQPCQGQNTEVEQAVGPSGSGYVYEAWSGCQGIGFSRSTNGGVSFSAAVTLPGSTDSPGDPVVAVSSRGTLFVAFMSSQGNRVFPVVDSSFDHGVTFPQTTSLIPPDPNNWGDSPNIAVAPDGDVYVTWDYGPSSSSVVEICNPVGSCSFTSGDLNVVVQASTDGGKTFGAMVPISPGYPWSGADNAPIVTDSSGRLDVIYQEYPTNAKTHAFSPAVNEFTSSDDGGATWSAPVAVGPGAGTMSLPEWWNEPGLGIDAGGNLYASWDTQGKAANGQATDIGWLSYSQDLGVTWSTPLQAPADQKNVPHIMEVAGGASGEADVGWLSDSNSSGYSLYVRPFSIASGWLAAPVRVSKSFGSRTVWPGDTFGMSTLDSDHFVTSWGSAVPTTNKNASVYAAEVSVAVPPAGAESPAAARSRPNHGVRGRSSRRIPKVWRGPGPAQDG